jgi:hypothetical protein
MNVNSLYLKKYLHIRDLSNSEKFTAAPSTGEVSKHSLCGVRTMVRSKEQYTLNVKEKSDEKKQPTIPAFGNTNNGSHFHEAHQRQKALRHQAYSGPPPLLFARNNGQKLLHMRES